jgi:hypothetical protein
LGGYLLPYATLRPSGICLKIIKIAMPSIVVLICEEAAIATRHSTVERHPIYSYGEILGRGERGCRVWIKVDYSQDKFGDAEVLNVDTYCYSLRTDSNSDHRYPDISIASIVRISHGVRCGSKDKWRISIPIVSP